ncbi:hypothetical protein BLNAU_12647 [Blattamonas nauphoetae]|uniref:Uncharacterized protein n=1 Tax=Blattamonas nauphoetae TaxID=2049346 RepID=A0ABQ9XLN6_9EUKA|nr:hypothetical protein BLNAU_12647 [Blattamonas nauphoetae]
MKKSFECSNLKSMVYLSLNTRGKNQRVHFSLWSYPKGEYDDNRRRDEREEMESRELRVEIDCNLAKTSFGRSGNHQRKGPRDLKKVKWNSKCKENQKSV